MTKKSNETLLNIAKKKFRKGEINEREFKKRVSAVSKRDPLLVINYAFSNIKEILRM